MSVYGRLWEEIRSVRLRLAAELRRSTEALPTLEEARNVAANHEREIQMLLAKWVSLEEEAKKCNP